MTRRTRSMLLDASLGKIFTNTNQIAPNDPSKLIAGTKLSSSTINSLPKGAIAKVTKNLSGNPSGIKFTSGGLVTAVIISAVSAPKGRGIIFQIRVGSTYETSTVIDTEELEDSVKTKTVNVAWSIPAGNNLYVDIIQVGNIKAGATVSLQFNYYTGLG
jgi:hypothetical protein